MSTITFDTLRLVKELRTAGIPQEQAEAVVKVIADAQENLVTRDYLDIKLAPISAELSLIKWMMGILIALAVANFAKQFF